MERVSGCGRSGGQAQAAGGGIDDGEQGARHVGVSHGRAPARHTRCSCCRAETAWGRSNACMRALGRNGWYTSSAVTRSASATSAVGWGITPSAWRQTTTTGSRSSGDGMAEPLNKQE